MYKVDTARNTELSELLAKVFVVERGWMCSEAGNRDSPYDLVADLGDGKFERIQVKKVSNKHKHIKRVVSRKNQKVTTKGKIRSTIDYAELGIEWLFGVDIFTKEIFTYKLETYKNLPQSISVGKWECDDFPTNGVIKRNVDFK